jgi:hypothetical protein
MANNVNVPAFAPGAPTVNIAAATTSANVQVTPTGLYARNVRVYNSGTVTVFIAFGNDNTVVATTTAGLPIAAGEVTILSCPHSWVAAITGSSTSTIYFTVGEGNSL